jgi:hypothetical protein
MKKPTLSPTGFLAVLAAVMLATLLPAHAVLIEYTGNQVASSPWALFGSTHSTTNSTITFGTGVSGGGAIYAEQTAVAPSSLWNPGLTSGFVEITFEIDVLSALSYSTGLAIHTGTREWDVLINGGVIIVNGGLSFQTLAINTGYTLGFTYDAAGVDVSLNGSPLASLQNVAGATAGSPSAIWLHRYTSSIGTDSQATYHNVDWQAVPEPGTVGLLGLSAGLGLLALRRRAVVARKV